jgi:uncharacterized YigZ family protein
LPIANSTTLIYSYLTLREPTQGIYKEKGSKFISFAYPVSSETDIKEKLEILKKEFFDARHHCFAWMVGAEKKKYRAFDDGEPNHSAGDPILGQIRAKGITDVLVVVVRYFGGVKLGVGGLITAYKTAADDALGKATIIEKEIMEEVIISFDYQNTSEVMRLLKDLDIKIIQQDFDESSIIKTLLPLKQRERFMEKIVLMKAMGRSVNWEFVAGK